ncbi:MAG: GlcNAc-transferase family protein [Gammaproteobacteria bacterium]|uniref:Glycosyltransferase n=1 Tax=SAR86 cluster bacterium TaxID=2030880 RepID=A0A520N0C9_9GAMM|nr:hypothetical protein [Gammaproteobacteria bacterium]MBA4729641.1 hypothetical protein [SAR86 cluster bacterium]RZO26937.1 MAG: hypothetical protein EVA92_01970 [SAR86 cluster bacterium]|tara:strand:+ start:12178 stop:13176 length:999 start_codon:yes stop_codon:yes gene_type:complete
MNIFLSISSYKDPLLSNTLLSAYNNASNKSNIVFAIVDQNTNKLDLDNFEFKNQMRYLFLDAKDARGCAWARSLAQSLYMGEDYFFQVDSHTIFEPNWDVYFIDYFKKISKKFHRPVISNYPRNFEIIDLDKQLFQKYQEDDQSTHVMVIDKDNVFKEGYFSMKKGIPSGDSDIKKGFLIAGGCIFAAGSMINEVPYDPFLYFDGEEDSLAWRLFTNGYNVFHTPNTPLYHYYVNPDNAIKRPFHWDQSENIDRPTNWTDLKAIGRARLDKIVEGTIQSPYGIGKTKSFDDYANFSGLDIPNKQVLDPENVFSFNKLNSIKWSSNAEKFSLL